MKTLSEFLLTEKEVYAQRKDLPQIRMSQIEDLKNFLGKNFNIKFQTTKVKLSEIKMSQLEIDKNKVQEKMAYFKSKNAEVKPFIVSADMQIIDSHHQFVALRELHGNDFKVIIIKASVGTDKLLAAISEYSGAEYKTIAQ